MSVPCPHCGGRSVRQHRTLFEHIYVRKVRVCEQCKERDREFRRPFESTIRFFYSRHTRCIQCGSTSVRRLPSRDRIDRMSSRPYSVLIALTGAPIYYCGPCRLQYHDWRSPEPAERQTTSNVAG